MASRRKTKKRRRVKRRFSAVFKFLFVVAVVVAVTMGATVFFQVETMSVLGNSRYTPEEIVQTSGIKTGDNLFRMNKHLIASRVLEELPYVKDLHIRRELPSSIVLTVTEWDAVARVKAPEAVTDPPVEGAGDSSSQPLEIATEDWLISLGGKLLEPAAEEVQAITVSGITPIAPQAGKLLNLPEEERPRLDGLVALLAQLDALEMMENVSSVQLNSTHLVLRYLERFDVKMPLNADFRYKLRVLSAAVIETEKKLGSGVNGTFDLTQEGKAAVFSPSK